MSVVAMPGVPPHSALIACAQAIATLEAALEAARTLEADYVDGRLAPSTVLPLRRLCARIVDDAIDLSRDVSTLTGQHAREEASR